MRRPARWNQIESRAFLLHLSRKESQIVNKDQVKGVAKQAKGAVKDAAGKVTGDRQMQASGKADKVAGKVQKAYGDVKEDVKRSM